MGAPAASNSSVITFVAPGWQPVQPVSRIKKGKVYCLIIPLVVWHVISINFWDAKEKKQWKGWKKTLLLCWDFTELLPSWPRRSILRMVPFTCEIIAIRLVISWIYYWSRVGSKRYIMNHDVCHLASCHDQWFGLMDKLQENMCFFLIFPHESWVVKIPPCSSMSVSTSQSWRPSWCGRRPLQNKNLGPGWYPKNSWVMDGYSPKYGNQ